MSYSKVNLTDVKDNAVEYGLSEIQESKFPQGDVEAETTGFAYHRIKPGQRTPFSHRHEQAEEVHLVLRGSGTAVLGGENVALAEMDLLRLSPEVTRTFEAGPDGLDYLVFGPHHAQDGEVIEGDAPGSQ